MNLETTTNENFSEYKSLPVITISDKYGTRTYQPKTEEEYQIHLREKDENHQKTANAVGILLYSTIFLISASAYTIYYFIKK